MEKELDGHSELIGAEEADILYGVCTSNSQSVHDVLMNLKESVEQSQSDTETEDSDSENLPMDNTSETDIDVHVWFDDEDEDLMPCTNILKIIAQHIKEVKKFCTP
jgi:hypothetical protein